MNNKVLVTVRVPLLEESYDIFIPISKKISATKILIAKAVNELSNGDYPIKDNITLMSNMGDIFGNSLTVKESQIKNGDTIILL